jgi:hypothetical protein
LTFNWNHFGLQGNPNAQRNREQRYPYVPLEYLVPFSVSFCALHGVTCLCLSFLFVFLAVLGASHVRRCPKALTSAPPCWPPAVASRPGLCSALFSHFLSTALHLGFTAKLREWRTRSPRSCGGSAGPRAATWPSSPTRFGLRCSVAGNLRPHQWKPLTKITHLNRTNTTPYSFFF